jgi:hypothetical protein
MPDEPYTFRIPHKCKDEPKCPLPAHLHKICRDTNGPNGWDCLKYCWRNIIGVIMTLGKRTFIVDVNLKEFDFSQLEKGAQPKEPVQQAPAEKNPFDW